MMKSSPNPAEGAAQRCNPRNYMLRRQGRGDRDRTPAGTEDSGTGYWYSYSYDVDNRFGYALLGFTAASAATAGLVLVLVTAHPRGKSWCVRACAESIPTVSRVLRVRWVALDRLPTNESCSMTKLLLLLILIVCRLLFRARGSNSYVKKAGYVPILH